MTTDWLTPLASCDVTTSAATPVSLPLDGCPNSLTLTSDDGVDDDDSRTSYVITADEPSLQINTITCMRANITRSIIRPQAVSTLIQVCSDSVYFRTIFKTLGCDCRWSKTNLLVLSCVVVSVVISSEPVHVIGLVNFSFSKTCSRTDIYYKRSKSKFIATRQQRCKNTLQTYNILR